VFRQSDPGTILLDQVPTPESLSVRWVSSVGSFFAYGKKLRVNEVKIKEEVRQWEG